jgi:glutathione S-transferase
MKLYQSPASPYARKVRAFSIECGLAERIQLLLATPRDAQSDYGRINPLQRIPALQLEDGSVLYDSPVICDYLDSLHGGPKLIPGTGPVRWHALKLQALGDGIMDAAVPRRAETLRPAAQQSPEQLKLYERSIRQALDALEGMVETFGEVHIGTLAVAAALGYLDFRFPGDAWRTGRPQLARWFAAFAERRSMVETDPNG